MSYETNGDEMRHRN